MIVLIGGASSTGSSLLNQLMGRHSEALISQESSLFARPQLIMDWAKYKHRIISYNKIRSLKSFGWHRENGVNLQQNEWGVSSDLVTECIRKSRSFASFITCLEGQILSPVQSVWIEKTPPNALTMEMLSEQTLVGHNITTIRHPLEAIASMVHRGYDEIDACCIYLLNSAYGIQLDLPNWSLVRYEDLVQDYKSCINGLFERIDLDINKIDWDQEGEDIKIDGWRFYENQLPVHSDESRFEQLPSQTKSLILSTINSLRIRTDFSIYGYRPSMNSIIDIARYADYDIPDISNRDIRHDAIIRRRLTLAAWHRSLKFDPIHYFNLPFELSR